MKKKLKILTALTIFLIESQLANSMEEAQEATREKGPENVQQIEPSNNSLKNPELMNSINSNSVPSKINIDELPSAETEIRFYRKRTGSTTTETITFKVLDDLKEEMEKIDTTVVYFNNQMKNKIKEEAQSDTHEEAPGDTTADTK